MSDLLTNPLILTAMEMEARGIAKELTSHGLKIAVEIIGIRACRLPRDLAEKKPSLILLAGLGGGLDPVLKVGDVILDDPRNLALAATIPRGTITTAKNVVATVAGKAELRAQTGAAIGDMENSIVRAAAAKVGIPFIGLRAVSDTADQSIDPEILNLVDEIGRPRTLPAMKYLATHPGSMSRLHRLREQSNRAVTALAASVVLVLESMKL
jgi:hypothetical protein